MDGTDGSGGPMVSRVELAILANGGGDYDEKACECDASVGATPISTLTNDAGTAEARPGSLHPAG
jgi:hypothetical protein